MSLAGTTVFVYAYSMQMRSISAFKRHLSKISLFLCCLLLSNTVQSYGGYHYGHGYGHYGHHSHISVHAHSGLGYFLLGLAGIAIISHILDRTPERRYTPPARHTLPSYKKPVYSTPVRIVKGKIPPPIFTKDEGWNALITGDNEQAMTIFAYQSQQDMTSGLPKIGFALATASSNQLERGMWSMRKALRHDPNALLQLGQKTELLPVINQLIKQYKSDSSQRKQDRGKHDQAFMIASLSVINNDYLAAKDLLNNQDHNKSTNNLRALIGRI